MATDHCSMSLGFMICAMTAVCAYHITGFKLLPSQVALSVLAALLQDADILASLVSLLSST